MYICYIYGVILMKWIISGYYYDGKTAYTLLVAADGSGKTKRVKGVL